MKKPFIYLLILLVVVGGLAAYIISRGKGEDVNPEDSTKIEKKEEKKDGKIDSKKESKKVEKKEKGTIKSDTDFSTYSSKTQEVGQKSEDGSEDTFVLESITDSKKDGYHSFVFTLSGEKQPYAVASYNSSSGVVRLDLYDIEKDSSGIAYQGKRDINEGGVTKLYRAVSGVQKRSIYEVGVEDQTVFKLTSEEGSTDNKWEITLNVKYPGEREVDVDLGSEKFSREDQEIKGGSEASVLSYSYSAGGGIMKFVWGVSASGNPIPTVKASLDTSNDLVVVFEDVGMDKVGGAGKEFTLPFGIVAKSERSGSETRYTFTGMTEKSEYMLSAGLSPNQVILEIKK